MTDNVSRPTPEPANEKPLDSWKEIAVYLKRGVRTVKRWEKSEGLPVRRHQHQARSSVYAYPSELEAWLATRQPAAEPETAGLAWRRPVPALALVAVVLLALISVGSSRLLNPTPALAQSSGGIVARQIWAGPEVDVLGAPSPDGRYLTYVHWDSGNLALRDVAAGTNRMLTKEGSWSRASQYAYYSIWSPDGQQVAYTWFDPADRGELRLVGLDGGPPRVLLRDEEFEYVRPHAWSRDGQSILALFRRADGSNQIGLVSVGDGSVRVLKSLDWRYPTKMSLSPDGKHIVYDFPPKEESPQRDIFLLAADGSREIAVVAHPANDYGPVWTPDGKAMVFASDRSGTVSAWLLPLGDGASKATPRLVKDNLNRMMPMAFTREGTLCYALVSFENAGDVYIANLDPTTGAVREQPEKVVQRFEGWNTSPAWSPDGKYLAYVSQRGPLPFGWGTAALVIRDLATGEERDLWPKLERLLAPRHSPPRWSPDGRSLLLTGRDVKGRRGLYLVSAQTGEVAPFLELRGPGAPVEHPAWSPDGKRIFYVRRGLGIMARHVDARQVETGRDQEVFRGQIQNLALSPDGRQLAFANAKEIMTMPAAGGNPRRLLRLKEAEIPQGSVLAWTPDGRSLVFVKGNSHLTEGSKELWLIPAEGGEPRQLGPAMAGIRDLTFHPQQLRLAFTGGGTWATVTQIWALENFLPEFRAGR